MRKSHLTVGEAARLLGAPDWRIRRIADELDAEIPRAGRYRLIPRRLLGKIEKRLAKLQPPSPERSEDTRCRA